MKAIFKVAMILLVSMLCARAIAAENLPLGPGDAVKITVYNLPDLTTETQISSDGKITFPLIGQISISGMTFSEVEKLIAEKLSAGGFVKNPNVTLLVTQYRSQKISVVGEVNHPGRILLDSITTLPEAIAIAGGIAPTGGDRVVLIRQDNAGVQVKKDYSLSDLLDKTATGKPTLQVQHGDVIYVPKAPQFYVYGEVQKPGMFRLDASMNVMQAISASGSFTPKAETKKFTIFRKKPDGSTEEIRASLNDLLQPDDVLLVKESLF